MKNKPARPLMLAVSIVAAAALLAACGDKKGGATQVAAKVNKEEISVHQVNFVLQRTPGLTQDQVGAAGKRILEGLIDQELAVQQAHEQKLDRDPNVVMAMEAARRDVLARAYADKLGSTAAKPTEAEVADYFAKHPGLFEKRRGYSLTEIVAEVPPASQDALIAKLQADVSAAQAVAVLEQAGVRYAQRNANQVPENLPLPLVDKLAGMSVGQHIITKNPGGLSIVYVTNAVAAPVALDKAKPAIEAFLLNQRRRDLIQETMKGLRRDAKIEYMGQFGVKAASAPAAASESPAVVPPEPTASSLDANALQKGLSGLK